MSKMIYIDGITRCCKKFQNDSTALSLSDKAKEAYFGQDYESIWEYTNSNDELRYAIITENSVYKSNFTQEEVNEWYEAYADSLKDSDNCW